MGYVVVKKNDELQHHGTKGMRWGIRRYQNKDGSLTPAGQKRYNKEVEKLNAEKAKVAAAEKVAANRKKTQTKIDKLEAEKQKLEERKKALKGKSDASTDADKAPEETNEQRRERVLKSTNPKEIYENRDVLTYNELNERVNRIDLEARLQNKIPVEHQKTGMDYVDSAKNTIDKATGLFRSVDNAYSAVANSAIGKTLAKQLGLEVPKKTYDYDINNFLKDIKNKSPKEINEFNQAQNNIEKLKNRTKNNDKSSKKADKESTKKSNSDSDDKNTDNQSKQNTKSSQESKTETIKATSDAKQRNADVNEQIRKASDALKEVNMSSSETISKANSADTLTQDLIRRNNQLMSELDNKI